MSRVSTLDKNYGTVENLLHQGSFAGWAWSKLVKKMLYFKHFTSLALCNVFSPCLRPCSAIDRKQAWLEKICVFLSVSIFISSSVCLFVLVKTTLLFVRRCSGLSSWCHHSMETLIPSLALAYCITGGIHRSWVDSLYKQSVIQSFYIFLSCYLEHVVKQSICQWLEMPWHSCDVTLMS